MASESEQKVTDATGGDSAEGSATWDGHLQTLRELVEVVHERHLSEIELEHNGVRLSLKSAAAAKSRRNVAPAPESEYAAHLHHDTAETEGDDFDGEETEEEAGLYAVLSPMTGTFYRAQSPTEPNCVVEGDRVEVGQVLGLVEAMKVFNEITSEVEGTVTAIRIASSGEVGIGDVLMTIRQA